MTQNIGREKYDIQCSPHHQIHTLSFCPTHLDSYCVEVNVESELWF